MPAASSVAPHDGQLSAVFARQDIGTYLAARRLGVMRPAAISRLARPNLAKKKKKKKKKKKGHAAFVRDFLVTERREISNLTFRAELKPAPYSRSIRAGRRATHTPKIRDGIDMATVKVKHENVLIMDKTIMRSEGDDLFLYQGGKAHRAPRAAGHKAGRSMDIARARH